MKPLLCDASASVNEWRVEQMKAIATFVVDFNCQCYEYIIVRSQLEDDAIVASHNTQ